MVTVTYEARRFGFVEGRYTLEPDELAEYELLSDQEAAKDFIKELTREEIYHNDDWEYDPLDLEYYSVDE